MRNAPPKRALVYQKIFKWQKTEDMGRCERGGAECTQGVEKEERRERVKPSRSGKKQLTRGR